MAGMNWHSILAGAKFLGTAVIIVSVIAILIFGTVAQTQRRITRYKTSRRFMDFLKIFSRY
jgi:hypothetical protein